MEVFFEKCGKQIQVYENPLVDLIAETKSHEDIVDYSARICTQKFSEGNLRTKLLDWGHMSPFEHESYTLQLNGISRLLSHEIVRHRHLSFSQVSTRYVTMTSIVLPVELRPASKEDKEEFYKDVDEQLYYYYKWHNKTKQTQLKQSRELCRSFLPHCVNVMMIVTGNSRAWYEMLQKRDTKNSSLEFQELCHHIKKVLPDVRTSR